MTQQWQPGKTYPPLGAALSFPGLHHLPQMTMEARGVGDLARSLRSWGTSGSAYWNLTEGPLAQDALPELLTPLRDELRDGREKSEAIAHLLRWEAGVRESVALLRAAGLSPPLVLKGGSSKYALYPVPYLRTSSDIDLLLPEGEVEEAVRALSGGGYTLVVTDRRRPHTAVHGHQVMLRRGRTVVELHRALDNLRRPSLSYGELFSSASPLAALDPWLHEPSIECLLLIAAAHSLKHGLLIPLRDLVDVQLALESSPLDESLLKSMAREAHLHETLSFLALQAGALSGRWTPLHSSLAESLPTGARLFYNEWRQGGNKLGDGAIRKLVAHAALTPGSDSTRQLVARFVQRRLRDFLAK